jgi:hypothetical protein
MKDRFNWVNHSAMIVPSVQRQSGEPSGIYAKKTVIPGFIGTTKAPTAGAFTPAVAVQSPAPSQFPRSEIYANFMGRRK